MAMTNRSVGAMDEYSLVLTFQMDFFFTVFFFFKFLNLKFSFSW